MKKVIKNTKKVIKLKKKSELEEFKDFFIKKFDEKSEEMHGGFVAINEGFKEEMKEVFRSDFAKIDNRFSEMDKRFDRIENDLSSVKEDLLLVKEDLLLVKSDVKAIKKHLIKDVDPRIENLESQYVKLTKLN
jgi:archaellum component FlaC